MRRLGFVVAAAVVMMVLSAHPADGAGGGSSETSPSSVLRKVDAKLGAQPVNLAPRGETAGPDRTLAPYFHVAGRDSDTEQLPLKETRADVRIAGVIAHVKVHQVFENHGAKPIEAVYVFPASTRAAVHGVKMRIGERTVEARIQKRDVARRQYEQAKQDGKRASLLEQERPNVFTMSVANLMPRDRIQVELDYSELLVPEDATYEFVYPTVVGPRYGGGADPAKDRWISSPYLTQGKPEPYQFSLQVHVESGISLKEISSPSHAVSVKYRSPSSADVSLAQPGGGNKDFVLRYRLAGDRVETGLLLWKGEKENFFVLMMEPPQRPTPAQIPPREYIFLLDISGSMHGFPLDTSKALMRNLFSQLRPTDSFNVATFSGGSFVLNPGGSLPATPANVELASNFVSGLRGGGGTELMGGLQMAYAIPKKGQDVARTVVLVTDGYVGVEAQAFRFVRERLGEANLFAFGIGGSVNRGLIEGVARAGQGTPFVVLDPSKAAEVAARFQKYIQSPVLTHIQVRFPGFDAREVAPSNIPDLLAQRPIVLFGKYRGGATGKVTVSGATGGGRYEKSIDVAPSLIKEENGAIRWLWARKWVEILDDERSLSPAPELEEAITDLGLSYGLLTQFTSFVAIDSEVVNRTGGSTTVAQPLPLPEGVSDLAVAGRGRSFKSASSSEAIRLAPAPSPHRIAPMQSAATSPAKGGVMAEKDERKEEVVHRIVITDVKAERIADVADLLRAVEAQLAKAPLACRGPSGEVTVKLIVNAAGKVIRVEISKPKDASNGRCLRALLEKVSSSSKPSSGSGVVQLTLQLPGT